MKKLLPPILSLALLLTACYDKDIQEINNRLDNIENQKIATLSEQIDAINKTIPLLSDVDEQLSEHISSVEETSNKEIAALKDVNTSLKNQIADLEKYVNEQLSKTTDWVNGTFATLEQHNTVVAQIEKIKTQVDNLKPELLDAISKSEEALKTWVSEQLTDYYKIAEIDAKIEAIENSIKSGDETITASLNELKESLQATKTALTEAYTKAIEDAITNNNGVINSKIAAEIAAVNKRIDNEVDAINTKIAALEEILGRKIEICFDVDSNIVVATNYTFEIGYSVTSSTNSATVEVTSSADIKAKVVTNGLNGKISITTGNAIDEYSKVVVFVSNGENVIMRSITFEQATVQINNSDTKTIPVEGGTVELSFLTNVECEVVIPSSASSWLSVVPTTRALEERTITLQATANEGDDRSAVVTVKSVEGNLAVEYTINQMSTKYHGIPTIKVTPASLNVALAGGTTEQVVVETPAEWTLEIDTEGVVASAMSGNGDAVITFEVPAAEAMRTIKATFTATGYVSGYPITKKASVSISQSDSDIPAVGGAFVYYEDGGESVSKVDGYWPYVDKYTGWNPQGGEGFDQSGVTYTGKNASVRNSGKSWAPVGATYATDAPYAYLQAKTDSQFVINNINIKSGVKNYIFSFTAFNQYASEIGSPYAPAPVSPLKASENLTLEVSVDGSNFGAVTFSTMADGNWEYAVAPFTLPADADKLYVRFSGYKADTTTPLPSSAFQYQAALRFDDFRLVEGGNGPVVDFNNAIGGGNTGGGDVPTEAVKATVAEFLAAAEDGTTYYELTGVISNVTNTTYGNFDLTDSTGTVLIYGLCSPTGEQKYWAASGAKSGDTITVRTLRTSYNNTPQGKDAIFVSLVPGEGGDEPTPEPAEGAYASDVPFVCAADDSTNAAYSLAATTINGQAATGFKLGKSKQQGKFTSTAIGVSGTKYINFYAAAWKGTTATLYFRVDGGAVQSVALAGNTGATGNPPYPITFADTDHYSVKLEGLTEASTIEFGTNADLALTTHSGKAPDIAPRVIVCGVKLTDEPLGTDNPGGTTPEPEPDPTPTPDPTHGSDTTVSTSLNASLTWTEETDATYGKGFYTTVDGVKMGYYQGASTTTPVAAKDDHIRVYTSSVFVIVPAAGQKVKNVNINVTYAATYALNMTVEGADNAIGNKENGTITWTGSVDKFVATASEGQIRFKDISVVVGE